MAGIKISALPAVTSALVTDFYPVVQAGVTSRETVQQLVTLLNSSSVLTGFVPIGGGTMTGPLILSGDATAQLGAVTLQQLNILAGGFTVILAAQIATTANLGAVYANGAAGVGATLTNSGVQVALTIDGVLTVVGTRVLVKNQTSTFENGVYEVTVVGTGATNWVLTRVTDYDTAAEIQPGTLIAVNAGTVNASTSWLETATVVTVGTDPVLFSQFTFAPGAFLLKANNLADVASVATSLVNLGLGVPTGTGNVVRQTSPTLVTPILGAATATSIAFNPTTSGIIGTNTNNNASAGIVGEFISSSIIGSPVALTSNIARDITSLNISAGDWDINGMMVTIPGGPTQSSAVRVYISNISNAASAISPNNSFSGFDNMPANPGQVWVLPVATCRQSVAGPTTIYLGSQCAFSGGTLSASGWISARRVR